MTDLQHLILVFRNKIANEFRIERTPKQIENYFRGTLNVKKKRGLRARMRETILCCLKDEICYKQIVKNLIFLGKDEGLEVK